MSCLATFAIFLPTDASPFLSYLLRQPGELKIQDGDRNPYFSVVAVYDLLKWLMQLSVKQRICIDSQIRFLSITTASLRMCTKNPPG
ncbi:hypothetical protein FIBSPDRAFT_847700, partial [Athelia psychrophila]